MTDKKVVLYYIPTWPHCHTAKEYLSRNNIPYTEFNVAADRNAAKEMVQKTNQLGVPVIIIDDKDIVIGFNPERLDKLLSPGKEN